jgi:hypothetical protein
MRLLLLAFGFVVPLAGPPLIRALEALADAPRELRGLLRVVIVWRFNMPMPPGPPGAPPFPPLIVPPGLIASLVIAHLTASMPSGLPEISPLPVTMIA